jgi:hypothetical protein
MLTTGRSPDVQPTVDGMVGTLRHERVCLLLHLNVPGSRPWRDSTGNRFRRDADKQ